MLIQTVASALRALFAARQQGHCTERELRDLGLDRFRERMDFCAYHPSATTTAALRALGLDPRY